MTSTTTQATDQHLRACLDKLRSGKADTSLPIAAAGWLEELLRLRERHRRACASRAVLLRACEKALPSVQALNVQAAADVLSDAIKFAKEI